MKKRILALLLCFTLLLGLLPAALTAAADGEVKLNVYQGESAVSAVTLYESSKLTLTARPDADVSGAYQWQIKAGSQWANIVGSATSGLELSFAMIANVLDDYGQAFVRCRFITSEGKEVYSGEITVQMDVDPAQAAPMRAPASAPISFTILDPGSVEIHNITEPTEETDPAETTEPTDATDPAQATDPAEPTDPSAPTAATDPTVTTDPTTESTAATEQPTTPTEAPTQAPVTDPAPAESQEPAPAEESDFSLAAAFLDLFTVSAHAEGEVKPTYNVVITYVDECGNTVASPYTASLAGGSSFDLMVTFPTVQGYLPYYKEQQANSISEHIDSISQDLTFTVVYKPTYVSYTVIHYQQNVGNDQYAEFARETKQGLTNSTIPDVAKNYDGFYVLPYEQAKIAASGDTIIEVYYDRYYYLMNFDLDGGYGTDPIYARYGAKIENVQNPTKAGYTFGGWSETKDNQVKIDLPDTMPYEHKTYYAIWKTNDTAKVTVVFWGENADDEEYSYLADATKEIYLKPGTKFTYTESGMLTCGKEVHTHGDACLSCGKTEHTHSAVGGSCYELTCGQTSHSHSTSCYEGVGSQVSPITSLPDNPTDGLVTDHWYYGKLIYIKGKWYKYNGDTPEKSNAPTICGQVESNHTHSDSCYKFSCTIEEHTHSATCYTCGKEEHTHNSDCYMQGAGLDSTRWKFVRSDTITVAADGSSVVNVYYDRVEYNVGFYSDWNCSSSQEYTNLRITAKWGASILSKWPTYNKSSSWYVENKSDTWQNSIQVMPVGGAKFWGPKTGNDSYKASYYVEVLPGESGTDYNGVTYKLHHEDTSVSSGSVSDEEKYDIKGFTYKEGTDNGSSYSGAKFYYIRNSYKLTFNNGEEVVKSEDVKYEAPLGSYDFTPSAPSRYEPGSVKFAGWYLNPECSGNEYKLNEHTMPADNVLLYAKWVPVTHTVEFHLTEKNTEVYKPVNDEEASFVVDHGGNIAKEYVEAHLTEKAMNDAKPNGEYTFVVWFYYENGQKKYFDPTMQIRQDMVLFGEWSSKTLRPYTVRYVLQSTGTKVADDVTGSALVATTKTFDAKGGTELYAEYQEGFFPTVKSDSLLMNIDGENILTFEYVQKDAVPYTVKYINKETNTSVFDGQTVADKVVNDNRKAVVTETFRVIPGYMPDAYQKRLVVTAEGENILYFYYTKDSEHAYYKITHYTENLEGGGWTEYASSQVQGDIDKEYTADSMTIPGFTYDETVQETVKSGTLTAGGLELKLYYTRNSYPYEVRYLEEGTGSKLHEPKAGKGKYGQIISENAIDIENYDKVDPATVTINIRIEEDKTTAKINIITFYYTEQKVTINYKMVGSAGCGVVSPDSESVKVVTGQAAGSLATPYPNFRFVGWYKDEACTQPVSGDNWLVGNKIVPQKVDGKNEAATYYAKFEDDLANLTITKSGANMAIDENQTFIFNITGPNGYTGRVVIRGNESVTIKGLKVGTYTVTEESAWSWRYNPKVGTQTVTLTGGQTSTVEFKNVRGEVKWLDGSAYKNNIFGQGN